MHVPRCTHMRRSLCTQAHIHTQMHELRNTPQACRARGLRSAHTDKQTQTCGRGGWTHTTLAHTRVPDTPAACAHRHTRGYTPTPACTLQCGPRAPLDPPIHLSVDRGRLAGPGPGSGGWACRGGGDGTGQRGREGGGRMTLGAWSRAGGPCAAALPPAWEEELINLMN